MLLSMVSTQALPLFGLHVYRWEYRELYEKDDDGDFVEDRNGKRNVVDRWVHLFFLSSTGVELLVEMEARSFEQHVLPKILEPLSTFWKNMKPNDSRYSRRADMLEEIQRHKLV